MQVIPAIDISEGQCVRLQQGDMSKKTVFGGRPADTARQWEAAGAELLHVVDLDGAVVGESGNIQVIKAIIDGVGVPVEVGGGLRTGEDVGRVLNMGAEWAIMGSTALSDREQLGECLEEFPGRIIVSIDARDGKVAVEGWTETSDVDAIDLAREVEGLGVERIIFTDISSDGMLAGPNKESIRRMAEAVSAEVVASGGITTLDDIRELKMMQPVGVVACIVGRALYSGTINLEEAIQIASEPY